MPLERKIVKQITTKQNKTIIIFIHLGSVSSPKKHILSNVESRWKILRRILVQLHRRQSLLGRQNVSRHLGRQNKSRRLQRQYKSRFFERQYKSRLFERQIKSRHLADVDSPTLFHRRRRSMRRWVEHRRRSGPKNADKFCRRWKLFRKCLFGQRSFSGQFVVAGISSNFQFGRWAAERDLCEIWRNVFKELCFGVTLICFPKSNFSFKLYWYFSILNLGNEIDFFRCGVMVQFSFLY